MFGLNFELGVQVWVCLAVLTRRFWKQHIKGIGRGKRQAWERCGKGQCPFDPIRHDLATTGLMHWWRPKGWVSVVAYETATQTTCHGLD